MAELQEGSFPMKNASVGFDLVLQSFLPSFSHTSCYIFTAILSSFCFGFFLGLSPLVFILAAVLLALFLSSVSLVLLFPVLILKVSRKCS